MSIPSFFSLRFKTEPSPGCWLFLFCLGLYLLTMSGHLYSTDDEIKGLIAEGIVERHAVTLPKAEMIYMNVGRGGLSYAPFPLGSSITMIPFYRLGDLLARTIPSLPRPLVIEFCYALINPIATALTCLVLFETCRALAFSFRTALLTTLLYGFCTVAWPYAKTAWSEPQATLCVMTGLYGVIRWGLDVRLRWMALAGAAVGYGMMTKYEMGVYALLFFLLALYPVLTSRRIPWRRALSAALAYGLPLSFFGLMILGYNYLRFERWTAFSHYSHLVSDHMEQSSPLWDSLKGIVVGTYQHLFSTGKGILLFSPPLLLFYWAIKGFWRVHRPVAVLCIALPAAFFISTGAFWAMSNIAWGDRYFVSLTPFLMVPLAALVSEIADHKGAYMKKSLVTLAAAGLAVQFLGVSINFQTVVEKQIAAGDPLDIQTLSYDPEYSPVLLHLKEVVGRLGDTWQVLRQGPERFMEARMSSPPRTFDPAQKHYRDTIRFHTFDFWFCYLYFLRMPLLLILIPGGLLAGLVYISGRRLVRLSGLSGQ
jgi:hypothetical protein